MLQISISSRLKSSLSILQYDYYQVKIHISTKMACHSVVVVSVTVDEIEEAAKCTM